MDDMLIFDDSLPRLREIFAALTEYADTLRLQLKPPTYTNNVRGVSFLGYKVYQHKILLNPRSSRRFAKKLQLYDNYFAHDIWSEKEYQRHLEPLFAFARHAYSLQFRKKTLSRSENHQATTTYCVGAAAVRLPLIAVCRAATTTTTTTGTTTTTAPGISVSALSSAHSLQKE